MDRLFSIKRRRPHIVDLITPVATPFVPGQIDEYRFKYAPNFDQAFVTIITAPNIGSIDDNVGRGDKRYRAKINQKRSDLENARVQH